MKKFLMIICVCLLLSVSANATPINFHDYESNAFLGQPDYPSQGTSGSYWISPAGWGFGVKGDAWLNFEIPVTITPDTMMHIGVRNYQPNNEILGLQFLDTFANPSVGLESGQAFAFAGSQTDFGIQDYRTIGNDWEYFDIRVGDYFTGTFGGIVFFGDDDLRPTDGYGIFRTIEFSAVPEPATMLLFGLGILGLAGVSRKKLTK